MSQDNAPMTSQKLLVQLIRQKFDSPGKIEDSRNIAWQLVKDGADPFKPTEGPSERKTTPLILAACAGHLHFLELFLRMQNADLTFVDYDDEDALLAAVFAGKIECARALLGKTPPSQLGLVNVHGESALTASLPFMTRELTLGIANKLDPENYEAAIGQLARFKSNQDNDAWLEMTEAALSCLNALIEAGAIENSCREAAPNAAAAARRAL